MTISYTPQKRSLATSTARTKRRLRAARRRRSPPRSSEVWPLQLVDPRDAEQVEELFRLMRRVPEVIEHYLDKHVFPETAQAPGHEAERHRPGARRRPAVPAAARVFGDAGGLAPAGAGRAQVRDRDGREGLGDAGGPRGCARRVPRGRLGRRVVAASGRATADPPDVARSSDTGALLTNTRPTSCRSRDRRGAMRSRRRTSESGQEEGGRVLETMGVVGEDVVEASRSAGPKYDAVPLRASPRWTRAAGSRFTTRCTPPAWTSGRRPAARAAVTLGKDMTLRDYAQGAWRMRQIGRGQRLSLLVTPEVKRLVERAAAAGEGRGGRGARRRRRAPGAGRGAGEPPTAGRARVAGGERHARGERAERAAAGAEGGERLAQARVPQDARRGRLVLRQRARRGRAARQPGRLPRARVVRGVQRGAEGEPGLQAPGARGHRAPGAPDGRPGSQQGARADHARRRGRRAEHGGEPGGTRAGDVRRRRRERKARKRFRRRSRRPFGGRTRLFRRRGGRERLRVRG